MAGNLWTWGIDYRGQPLLDAWWTPGWSAQNKGYLQVPPTQFAPAGFPQNLTYVNVVGNYFDTSANPLSGYLTFWPSDALTFNQSGVITYLPQRYSGINQTLLGVNQMGNERIYIWYGALSVSLLATDNANMTPASFTYHVKEHFKGGNQYDIVVPSADSSSAINIFNLIIPGSIRPADEGFQEEENTDTIRIPVSSSQFLAADVTAITAGFNFNPTSFPVNFAFISGASQPTISQWVAGGWANNDSEPPFVASILIGPNGYALAPGKYKVWVQVLGDDQQPVMPAGFVEIY